MTPTLRGSLLAAALFAAAGTSFTAPALADQPQLDGVQCRVELPISVDDRGRARAAGDGTTTCTGRLGSHVYHGADHLAKLDRLRLAPAAGGGYAISQARLRLHTTTLSYGTRQSFRVELKAPQHIAAANAQQLGGTATDVRGRTLSATAGAARFDGVCATKRRRCGFAVPSKLVLDVAIHDVSQAPAAQSLPAGLL
jgi:hypothetical protein